MTENRLKHLIDHYLQHSCSPSEERELLDFYDHFQTGSEDWVEEEMGDFEQTRTKILNRIQTNIAAAERPKQNNGYWKYIAAASVAVVIGLSLWFAYLGQSGLKIPKNSSGLILFDGTAINFNSYKVGDTINQSGATIIKLGPSSVSYAFSPSSATKGTIQSNTFKVAKGKLLDIRLADNSKIYLNANSSLTIPTTFSKTSRSAQLSGEAYFEIAKDKAHPFMVLAKNQHIDVLGTHFNVKAYPARSIKTTLVEGSVKVTNTSIPGKNTYKYLSPGEQSLLKAGTISVQKVAVENEIAWKDGYFIFQEDNIKSVMEDLSRWYDVEVDYHLQTDSLFISGRISKSKSLKETMQVLKTANNINFKLRGRRLTIMK